MKIISISTDQNIFKEDSYVRQRMVDYGGLVDELHIVVFSRRIRNHESRITDQKISNNVYIYPTNSLSKWFYVLSAIKIGKKINTNFDLVTAQNPFETGIVAYQIAKKGKIKFQLQIHTDLFSPYFSQESFINWFRVKMVKFLLPKADGIRVVSKKIKDSVESVIKNLKSEIVILPIFVDVEKLKKASSITDIHREYPGKKIVLVASRLEPEKNVSLAVEAFKKAIEGIPEIPETVLLIAGEGSERKKIKDLIVDHGLKDKAILLGHVPYDELVSYYQAANLLVLSSNYEGYGMVLVEGAAAGIPITTTIWAAESITGADVVHINDVDEMAKSIRKQLKNPTKTKLSDLGSYQGYLKKIKKSWEICL